MQSQIEVTDLTTVISRLPLYQHDSHALVTPPIHAYSLTVCALKIFFLLLLLVMFFISMKVS